MSAFFVRPAVSYPVRTCAPAFFARPAYPAARDIVPLFSLFDESLAQLEQAQRQARRQVRRQRAFNPKFNVKEVDGTYAVEGELPGFDAKDISVEFLDDGHTLQIKGRTVRKSKPEGETQAQVEANTQSKAVEDAPAATTSETGSVKSHQATVEDEVEEGAEQPANSSAVADAPGQEQAVAETSQAAAETQQPETTHWISERYTGSFTRSFQFPSKIDQEAVKASLKDGILAITLPFAKKPESRRINIE